MEKEQCSGVIKGGTKQPKKQEEENDAFFFLLFILFPSASIQEQLRPENVLE